MLSVVADNDGVGDICVFPFWLCCCVYLFLVSKTNIAAYARKFVKQGEHFFAVSNSANLYRYVGNQDGCFSENGKQSTSRHN